MPSKLSLADAQEVARKNGGECLSTSYENIFTMMKWKCSDRHEWDASFVNIRSKGSWCPECAHCKKKTLEEIQKVANQRGGRCLSSEYVSQKVKLRWECSEGHIWEATRMNVLNNNSWCATCYGNTKLCIREMQKLAENRGGQCLSTEYTNNRNKIKWKCSEGHQWWASPGKIKNSDQWCPHCRFKNETECKEICEILIKKPFMKCKPEWLKPQELDGYCEEKNLAFEYQGEQHHKLLPHWHKNGEADLKAQQERDAKKAALCQEHSVDLIVIDFDVVDKLGFITRELSKIFRKRAEKSLAELLTWKPKPPVFTIADDDPIWAEFGL